MEQQTDGFAASPNTPSLRQVLTLSQMVGLIFFEVSGGSYGIEPVVRAAGSPWLALGGIIIVPVLWSVPIALMTAEMCSAFPHIGGKIYFVSAAFGPYVGWLNGVYNAVGNLFDVAALPVLAVSYVTQLTGLQEDSTLGWFSAASLVVGACVLNVLGVELVGNASVIFTCIVCLPIVVMVILGTPRLPSLATTTFLYSRTSGLKFLSSLMWNTSGYDDAGATAAEIQNPQEVLPGSLTISVILVSLMYFLPVLIGLTAQHDIANWQDGELAYVAKVIGGAPLAFAVVLLGVMSSFGQLNALLCASVREIACMAELPDMPVPKTLARLHPKFETPHVSTILFSIVLLFLMNIEFTDLIAAAVFFDCFSFILQFGAWVKYRWSVSRPDYAELPDEKPGFRCTSLGCLGTILVSSLPVALCLILLALTMIEKGHQGTMAFGTTTFVASLIYCLQFAVAKS